MKPAVEVCSLTKAYPGRASAPPVVVLDHISLSIAKGEFVCLFGPNGCGKTTLLLAIAGVVKPDGGTIRIFGSPPDKVVVGFVFQNYREALLPWRTCLDNIAFPLELSGMAKHERRDRARQLVRELDLHIDLDSHPYQQSGGQQQLVAIARALISNPAVLVLDEPLSALDIRVNLEMRQIIERIWLKLGIPTICVSHDADECIHLADRIVLLSDRPATIIKILENTLPRPRLPAAISPESVALRQCILETYSPAIPR